MKLLAYSSACVVLAGCGATPLAVCRKAGLQPEPAQVVVVRQRDKPNVIDYEVEPDQECRVHYRDTGKDGSIDTKFGAIRISFAGPQCRVVLYMKEDTNNDGVFDTLCVMDLSSPNGFPPQVPKGHWKVERLSIHHPVPELQKAPNLRIEPAAATPSEGDASADE